MRHTFERDFYIPKEAKPMPCPGTDATIYVYKNHKGLPTGIAFHGKARKPDWHFCYRNEQALADKIKGYLDGRRARAESMATRKTERNKPHTLKVGDILYSSWGYDQTNIDFYQVVETKPRSVVIRAIASETTSSNPPQEMVSAVKDHFTGEPMLKRASADNMVRIASYARAHLWDGNPRYETSYGWGH